MNFKATEFQVYSQDEAYKLKAKSDVIGGLGDVVMTLKYGIANNDGSTSGTWPVYIPALATDYNNAPASVSYVLYQLNQADQAEAARAYSRESAIESKVDAYHLQDSTAISQETARAMFRENALSGDIASEVLTRQQEVFNLNQSYASEVSARSAGDSALSASISNLGASVVSNKLAGDMADSIIRSDLSSEVGRALLAESDEKTRAMGAESALSSRIDGLSASGVSDSKRAQDAEANLQLQISALLANTDAVALNSLAELVSDYRNNGAGLNDRLSYIEGVVGALVNKFKL